MSTNTPETKPLSPVQGLGAAGAQSQGPSLAAPIRQSSLLPTPRTDAAVLGYNEAINADRLNVQTVLADFARDLERELRAMTAERDVLKSALAYRTKERDAARLCLQVALEERDQWRAVARRLHNYVFNDATGFKDRREALSEFDRLTEAAK